MYKLNNNELENIKGGFISGSLLSSIVRGVTVLIDLGTAVGTAIRRIATRRLCRF